MKAIRVHEFGGPEVMKLEEAPDLTAGPGQVVVNLKAVGVNPVDTYIRSGGYALKPSLPYTPGMDAAGTVLAVGEGVDNVTVGERVYVGGTLRGAYAEQALCEAAQVHPLPARVSFAQGAGVNVPYATAYRALYQRAHGSPGRPFLFTAPAEEWALLRCSWRARAGLTVIGTAGTEKGQKLVLEQGAHHALDHRRSGLRGGNHDVNQGARR